MENKSIQVSDRFWAKVFYNIDCEEFQKIGCCTSMCRENGKVIEVCCVACKHKVVCPCICIDAKRELINKGEREE